MAAMQERRLRQEDGGSERGVTWRAVLVALMLMPVNSIGVYQAELELYMSWPTLLAMPLNVLPLLLFVVAVNAALRRWSPSHALTQGELLTVYVMSTISSIMTGWYTTQWALSKTVSLAAIAESSPELYALLAQQLPAWLFIPEMSPELRNFMSGGSTLYEYSHLALWVVPVFAWTLVFTLMAIISLCLNVIVRRQWIENERLSFPLAQLPLEMTRSDARLFRNRPFWIGMGISVFVGGVNGLHFIAPSIPAIPTVIGRIEARSLNYPWNGLGDVPIHIFPWVIGLGVLIPLEVCFSYWFFFWFQRGEAVASAAQGYSNLIPGFPFMWEQSTGALFGVVAVTAWTGHRHLTRVLRRAFSRDGGRLPGDPISYRTALLIVAVAAVVMLRILTLVGLDVYVAFVLLALYVLGQMGVARLRGELGAPANELIVGPRRILVEMGARFLFSPRQLIGITVAPGCSGAFGCDVTQYQLEGFKLAHESKIKTRGLTVAMTVAVLAGTFVAFWVLLHYGYKHGAYGAGLSVEKQAIGEWTLLEGWLEGTHRFASMYRAGFAVSGFTLVCVLSALRMRFLGWPLHPIGLALAATFWSRAMWPSMLIAWVTKLLLMRYGGRRLYVAWLPLFLGLILGDAVIGAVWLVWGAVVGHRLHSPWIPDM